MGLKSFNRIQSSELILTKDKSILKELIMDFDDETDLSRMSSKNNIFPVIVFGELFENLQLLSTETSGNGCWKVSKKAKLKTVDFKNACLSNHDSFQKKR
jgi:hypothetical protein